MAHITLAYITYKNVVLLTIKPKILREKGYTINLFLPMVYALYEKDKRIIGGGFRAGIRTAL
jgi:hypothetical protein